MSEAPARWEKDIMTLDGLIKLKVPTGINSGRIFAVPGRGVPHGHRFVRELEAGGDLMIKAVIRTPRKISKKAKDLIEELKKEGI